MQYQKIIQLRDGRACCLRSTGENDGQAVYDNFIQTHEETDYLLSYSDESTLTPEQEGAFLQRRADSDNEVLLIAVVDGRVVATAGITAVGGKFKVRHRADFGISVVREFWGLGIGRALTEACIACARSAGYTQLELSAVAENSHALALYEKAGFAEYGRNPRGFRSQLTGQYQELVYMRLEL